MLAFLLAYARRLTDIWLLTRPTNAISPLALVYAGAVMGGVGIDDPRLVFTMLALLFIHGAITMANDIEDIEIDRRNNVTTLLTSGMVSRRTIRWWVIGQVVLAAVFLAILPLGTELLAALLLAFGWAYNARPWYISRRPVGSIVVLALLYGVLPLLLGASLGRLDIHVVLLALAWGMSRVALSILKDYKDAVGDAMSNKRTFLLSYGHRWVRAVSLVSAFIGTAAIVIVLAFYLHGWGDIRYGTITVIAGVAVVCWRLLLYRFDTYTQLNRVFYQTTILQLIFDIVCVLWLTQSSII